jgi:beta-glucosidase
MLGDTYISLALCSFLSLGSASRNDTLNDTHRLEYLKSYIEGTLAALRWSIKKKSLSFFSSSNVVSFIWAALSKDLQSSDQDALLLCRNGANVKGYFTWDFLDVVEFLAGYQSRYGLYRVDFDDEALPRHARLSGRWYSAFLKNNGIHVQSELNNPGSDAEQ